MGMPVSLAQLAPPSWVASTVPSWPTAQASSPVPPVATPNRLHGAGEELTVVDVDVKTASGVHVGAAVVVARGWSVVVAGMVVVAGSVSVVSTGGAGRATVVVVGSVVVVVEVVVEVVVVVEVGLTRTAGGKKAIEISTVPPAPA